MDTYNIVLSVLGVVNVTEGSFHGAVLSLPVYRYMDVPSNHHKRINITAMQVPARISPTDFSMDGSKATYPSQEHSRPRKYDALLVVAYGHYGV